LTANIVKAFALMQIRGLSRFTIRPVLGGTETLVNILSRRPDRSAKRPALAFSQPAYYTNITN